MGLHSVLLNDAETTHSRLPGALLDTVGLANHADLVGDQVGRVEADIELANHGDAAIDCHRLVSLACVALGIGRVLEDFPKLKHVLFKQE